jgi:hypothetical protein
MAGFERHFQQLKESDMPKGVYERKPALDPADAPETAAPTVELELAAAIEDNALMYKAELSTMREQMARELADIQALKAKLEMQTTVRAEVAEALRLQEQETRRQAFGKLTPSEAEPMPPKPDEKLVTIRLDRNYRPMGYFEIAGWHKEEVRRKNAAGREVVVEAAEFIKGERKPPAIPGTGFANKYWAGQVLRVPASEAAIIRERRIGSIELD